MPAGEELDRMVAERVMGRRWLKNTKGAVGWACVSRDAVDGFAGDEWDGVWVDPTTPDYSTNIAYAFEIVEKLARLAGSFRLGDGFVHLTYAESADHTVGSNDGPGPMCNPGDDHDDAWPWSFHIHVGLMGSSGEYPPHWDHGSRFCARGKTASQAICIAALKALA
jgi:hypothetical protein